MDVAILVLNVLAPVFLLAVAGWGWARSGAAFSTDFVTRLVFSLSMPALIFTALARADIEASAFVDLMGAAAAAFAAGAAALSLILLALRLPQRTWLAALSFGNTGNVGLPVALFAFGEQGLLHAVVYFAVFMIANFTFGLWLVSGAASAGAMARQPMIWAVVLGLASALTDVAPPEAIMRSLELAGQAAIPLMLLTLGVSIARLSVKGVGRALLLSVLRIVPLGAAAWGGARLFGLSDVAADALLLQMIMPAAVTNYLLAQRFGRSPEAVAGMVVVSTALSVLYLPAVLALMLARV